MSRIPRPRPKRSMHTIHRFVLRQQRFSTSLRVNLIFVWFAALALFFVHRTDPNHLYTFGNPGAVAVAVRIELWLLCSTHVGLAAIVLAQHPWAPSEASTFRFIAVKAMFWTWLATTWEPTSPGIPLMFAVMLLLLTITTIDLDINIFRRYVLGSEIIGEAGEDREQEPSDESEFYQP